MESAARGTKSNPAVLPRPSLTGAKAMVKIFRDLIEAGIGITPEVRAGFQEEERCRRCGRCCYSAIRIKDRMVLLEDLPCKYLAFEPDGRASCSVYERRESTGWCHHINAESVRKELFPPDCPYVAPIARYRGKIAVSAAEFEELKPILQGVFHGFPRPEYVRAGDWDRFLHQTLQLPRP